MEEKPGHQESTEFLRTGRGKTESAAIEVPSISLPKGGGAIKGIDEKFTVNAVNGTSSFVIPLPFSPGRTESPELSLSYNSGSGNGIFGLGWSIDLPSIKRTTDKGLPSYMDNMEGPGQPAGNGSSGPGSSSGGGPDTFLLSDAEDLVPEYKKEADGSFSTNPEGDFIINEKPSPDGLFTIRLYRPRIDGLFARIERWQGKSGGEIKWRVTTRENLVTLFGWTENSRIADPAKTKRIFTWLPEFVFDDKGNCQRYIYKKEDMAGFDPARLHDRNRIAGGQITYTNLYPEKIFYGNKTPYKKFGDPFPPPDDFLFSTLFDYGEYDQKSPFGKIKDWDFRPDAFSDYRPGFEIRTTRLCSRILFYHHFTGRASMRDSSGHLI
jgi:hypothetical protein